MLEIEIDGKTAQVADGSTVMDAAQQMGVYIPHFCYHKKLSIAANCRMCLVQVEKAPKPLPACATPVTNGMKVFTHSELAVNAQKGVMEFLLINHPLDCPICDQGGECQLQDLAVGYGAGASRYQEEKRVVFHKNVGPLISMEEMSRCIHCTRCVRFGQEIAGVMELGMANRNMHAEITTFLGRSVDSELSGNMIDLCPVGALTSKPFRYSARAWELSRRRSVSPHDSIGANLIVQTKHDKVMRVLPFDNEEVNECWISDKDRFSYLSLNSSERLLNPMVRQDGKWQEVSWNVALDYVAHGLKDLAEEQGAGSLAALATPHSTLEELYLLQRMMRGLGAGCGNIDFRPRHHDADRDALRKGIPWLGMRLSEIAELDSVLVIGSFLRKDHPLLTQRLRQIVAHGASVGLMTVSPDDPLLPLYCHQTVSPSELLRALAALYNAIAQAKGVGYYPELESIIPDDTARRLAEGLLKGDHRAVFLGNVAEQHPQSVQIQILAQEIATLAGARLGYLGAGANSVGGYLAQALPHENGGLDGYRMFAEPRAGYVLFNVEPELDCHNPQLAVQALKQAKLVVMMTAFKHAAALDYADVLLPIAPFTETSGTFINTEGRIQSFSGVVASPGSVRPGWKVLRVLGNLLQVEGFDYASSEAVRNELLDRRDQFVSPALLDNALEKVPLRLSEIDAVKTTTPVRIADVPIYFADTLARRSPALQQTRDAAHPMAMMSAETAKSLGLSAGSRIRLRQGQGEACLDLHIDDRLPFNTVRAASAHPSTAGLGDMFGPITVEPV